MPKPFFSQSMGSKPAILHRAEQRHALLLPARHFMDAVLGFFVPVDNGATVVLFVLVHRPASRRRHRHSQGPPPQHSPQARHILAGPTESLYLGNMKLAT
jgi:hypothetical protein